MREFKFRAWDKDKNIIRVVNELDFLTESIVTKPIDGTSEMWELYDHVCFKGSYELMQYTGLKDKNGVEIYEGDIVKSQSGTGGLIYKHIVEWNNFYKRFDPMGTDESCFNRESCEVVGNIYENPELLEEK